MRIESGRESWPILETSVSRSWGLLQNVLKPPATR